MPATQGQRYTDYNNDKRSKTFERRAVELFQKAGGLGCEFKLQYGPESPPAPPDIVATNTTDREEAVGIEVTRIFNDETGRMGSHDRKRRGILEEIVNNAEEMHSQLCDRSCFVSVHFISHLDVTALSRSRKKQVSAMLVKAVTSLPQSSSQHFELRSEEMWGSDWPEEVLMIDGLLLEEAGPTEWRLSSNLIVGETTDELIQGKLNRKEQDIDKWRGGYKEAWILLVLDGSVESSTLRLHEGLETKEYFSTFNRGYVLGYNGHRYSELQLRMP
jgi:hypothetical protein